MYTIGLTGSIGSGKSTVAGIIYGEGYSIIDADAISRSLTEVGSPVIPELCEAFGSEILNDRGDLDRKKLAAIAFNSEEKKDILESIITLKVKNIIESEITNREAKGEEILFLDIPLLFEYKMEKEMDEVWSVVAEREIRYERAKARDGISREDFDARDAAQVSQEEKIANSDVVFHNNDGLRELRNRVQLEIKRVEETVYRKAPL